MNNEAEYLIKVADPANPARGNTALIVGNGDWILFALRLPTLLPPTLASMSGFEITGVALGGLALLSSVGKSNDIVRTQALF